MSGTRAYAHGTHVSAQHTQSEIMKLLAARGVTKMATMVDERRFQLAFEYEGVQYRIGLPLPDPDDAQFRTYQRGYGTYQRTESAAARMYEQELNRRWRAFGMVIKAKLVAVEEGITTMGAEFIGNAVLAGGRTVAETYSHQLAMMARNGTLPTLALAGAQTE